MRWAVPREFGGDELPPLELHLNYERLATASVATALILTQRDAAVGLIDANPDAAKRATMLRRFAGNEIWMTVGIAQLTTSRQGGRPALRAERGRRRVQARRLDPVVHRRRVQSQFIVAGATVDDGGQLLFLMQRDLRGVGLVLRAADGDGRPHADVDRFAAHGRRADRGPLGPSAAVGQRDWPGRRNGLTLGQTFIATGLCRAALDLIARHTSDAARSAHDRFAGQLEAVRAEVHALCQPGREADAAAANGRLRGTCNDFALRVTHAAVALYKGAALLVDHPAQRLAREAMFLLVWSCPNPVIDCTVDLLARP